MYYGGGGGDTANNRHPSFARHNGKEAIREALQHHVDRLQPNKTKAEFSRPIYNGPLESMQPMPKGELARVHAENAAAGPQAYFTPKMQAAANKEYRRNTTPMQRLLNSGSTHAENFLQLKQLGQQTTAMFNPTTKQGIANIASMFAGGPEGMGEEGAGMGGRMPPGMEPYDLMKASGAGKFQGGRALDVPNTRIGPNGVKGAGIRGLVRRAQGVGGYRQPVENPFNVLKGLEDQFSNQVRARAARQKIQDYSNRGGQRALRQDVTRRFGDQLGGDLTNYLPHHQPEPTVGNHDTQPFDFTDRLKAVRAYDNPQVQEAFGGSPDPIKQALYDMLFGGKGLLRRPQRPGPNSPYGSPYGGGPFG